jgi:hypothetical protein
VPKIDPPVGLVVPGLVATSPPSGLVSSPASQLKPTPNAVIPGTDFTIIDRPQRKAVILVFGDGGTGKSTFALVHTPQPAVLIGFDGRSEYIEEAQKQAGHPIPAVQIPPPSVLQKSDNVKVAAGDALKMFFRNYNGAIDASRSGKVRTICIDTGSELGEIITLSVRGTLDNVKGDYGRSKDQINQLWAQIFGSARAVGNAHLIILARASSIWENNEPTGDFKARVSDTVRDFVDFSLHIRLGMGAPAVGLGPAAAPGLVGGLVPVGGAGGGGVGVGMKPKEFELVVKKSGNKNPLEKLNEVYRQSDWGDVGPFAYACSQLMPGTTPDDWR